jgi:methylphosphotriester-DNA--protein-cysteine methyltransferase
MMRHNEIGIQELRRKIKNGSILYAGNFKLKIFGRLNCSSGKRMKKGNRIFFKTETEAIAAGFRPCGHCMPDRYRQWKLTSLLIK